MGRIAVSKAILAHGWIVIFVVALLVSSCSKNEDNLGFQAYEDYFNCLIRFGSNVQEMGKSLETHTKRIVECSSDVSYLNQLIYLKQKFSETYKDMLSTKVPQEFKHYDELNKKAMKEYCDMLDYLINSSMAENTKDKEVFREKAAQKIIAANIYGKKAMNMRPLDDMFKKYNIPQEIIDEVSK